MGTHQGHSRTYASASLLYKTIIFFASSWFPDITVPQHCQPMQSINEKIAQGAANNWDQVARAVFVFLRCEHCRVFLERCFRFCRQERCFRCCSEESRVLTGRAVAHLAQARYSAQILIFSRLKWLAQLYVFLRNTHARSTCYSLPRWAANLSQEGCIRLNRKMGFNNNKWDVIIKTGQ